MKKLIFIMFFIFCISFISPEITGEYAFAKSSEIYAKISSNNIYFYSLPEEKEECKLFILPSSYFVLLLSAKNQFYYAQYNDIFGYVKQSDVVPMRGVPSTPYARASFRVFAFDGLGLFKSPSTSAEKIATLPYLCNDFTFYGCINGEEAVPNKSNQWYFVKYASSGKIGYVYSVFCDNFSSIPQNTESFEVISSPLFTDEEASAGLSSVAMTFIVIGVSLPCLIVLYLLVKPNMYKEKLPKEKPQYKAKSGRDYFEFDESDLN